MGIQWYTVIFVFKMIVITDVLLGIVKHNSSYHPIIQATATTEMLPSTIRVTTATIGRPPLTARTPTTWTSIRQTSILRTTTIVQTDSLCVALGLLEISCYSFKSILPCMDLKDGRFFYFCCFNMSSYDHLPVYQNSFDLLIMLSKLTISFPKEYKYTFWERLQNYALEVIAEITSAALEENTKQKSYYLLRARKNIELIKILWRACNRIGILSHNQYAEKLTLLVSISKQITGRNNALTHRYSNPIPWIQSLNE